MNSVQLTGRAARDPDVRCSPSGTVMSRLTLAVDKNRAVKEGETSAYFIDVKCFGKTAEIVEKYVKKGRLVGVSGYISTGFYEKQGQRVYTTDILANRLEFLSRNPGDQKTYQETAAKAPQAPVATQAASAVSADAPAPADAPSPASAEESKAILEAATDVDSELLEGFESIADDNIPF